MRFTEEMIAEDEKRWYARDVVIELGYCSEYMCDRRDMTNLDIRFYAYIMRRAHEMLKAQEPRVMTLDEIGNALKMPIWKETKSAHKDLYTGWVLAYDIQKGLGITGTRLGMSEPSGRMVWYKLDDYGKTWRCWTYRPTYEQMKEAKWDDV